MQIKLPDIEEDKLNAHTNSLKSIGYSETFARFTSLLHYLYSTHFKIQHVHLFGDNAWASDNPDKDNPIESAQQLLLAEQGQHALQQQKEIDNLYFVDVSVDRYFPDLERVICDKKVARKSGNPLKSEALEPMRMTRAIQLGEGFFTPDNSSGPLILSSQGAGLNFVGNHLLKELQKLNTNNNHADIMLAVQQYGSYELACSIGFILSAINRKELIILEGATSIAAGLAFSLMAPECNKLLVFINAELQIKSLLSLNSAQLLRQDGLNAQLISLLARNQLKRIDLIS